MGNTHTRLPRHLRVANPPPMRLTARDVQVLQALYDYRVLRREQIQNLLFPSRNTANYRLQRLYQHGFLERRWRAVEYGQGTGQAIYLLGKRGAELRPLQTDHPESAGRPRASNTVHSPFLEHTLLVNDVRIAFALGTRKAGFRVERWVREDTLKAAREYVYTSSASGIQRQVAIIPDAYFVLNLGDRRAHFLLEVDRATETNARWKQKVQAYLAYVASGQYSRRFGTTSLRILVITTGLARLANLKRATERSGGQALFWFTTLEQAVAGSILLDRIWHVAGRQGTNGLITGNPPSQQARHLLVLPRNP